MKMYVDELPKRCVDCPFSYQEHAFDFGRCKFNSEAVEPYCRLKECPLQSLADYTKQVKKEVCEEIREKSKHFGVCRSGIMQVEYRINETILDQIQGE